MNPQACLEQVARGERFALPIAVVAAHPDDETLGLGARLSRFDLLTLIHLTDGAPREMGDAHRAGFETREAYAAARRAELDAALEAAEAWPARRLAYGCVDQEAVARLPELTERLAADLAGHAVVVTHAYEGGHPDHDAAACAVQHACERMGAEAPIRLEFAGYHLGLDGPSAGVFFADEGLACAADPADLARKRAALAAFASQAEVLARFAGAPERLRLAPAYDFTQPPAPGAALYDRYGWPLTSEAWRTRVAETFAWA